jgi:GR25 family glycosyltransferase involved in LPS biosynthesis
MEGKIHAYCINLKHRTDRWDSFNAQPEMVNFKAVHELERFDAVNGSTVNIKKDERISLRTKRNIERALRRDHEELDSAGGVGCYLSHTGVWKKFLERSEPYAIILEDDAEIPLGFTATLHKAMRSATLLPDVPDVWFFSPTRSGRWFYEGKGVPYPADQSQYKVGPWITKACGYFTGYLISRRGAERLLESAFPIDMHVDMYTCLNADMGRVFAVSHEDISIHCAQENSDINVYASCPICDIPSNYQEKGIVVVNIPILVVGLGIMYGLWYMSNMRRRR